MKIFIIFNLFAFVVLVKANVSENRIAPPCPTNPLECVLPDCQCSSTKIPGGLTPEITPQMVFLTFDGAITIVDYYQLFESALFNRLNPNGGKISATFFVNHQYNDYNLTHELWRRGHEIALNSISRKASIEYWKSLNVSGWDEEVVMQKKQMAHFAKIPESHIVGFRAPLLQTGGNNQFESISKELKYDCTRPTTQFMNPALWPYTGDFESIQECLISPCPTEKYEGFWTYPIINKIGHNGFPCSMIDSCNPQPETADETFSLLKMNFEVGYYGNKAPFGVHSSLGWLGNGAKLEGYIKFLDYLSLISAEKKDIYIVSLLKGLFWLQAPVKLPDVENFPPWFPKNDYRSECEIVHNCRFNGEEETPPSMNHEMYMTSCQPCPKKYPWLHNWNGTGDYPPFNMYI